MRSIIRSAATTTALLVGVSAASFAQSDAVAADVVKDIASLEEKVLKLTAAMPEAAWPRRPMAGTRLEEVFQHIATDNYFLPIFLGAEGGRHQCHQRLRRPPWPTKPGRPPGPKSWRT